MHYSSDTVDLLVKKTSLLWSILSKNSASKTAQQEQHHNGRETTLL